MMRLQLRPDTTRTRRTLMREWCSCGAAIRGTKRTVYEWRDNHLHEGRPEPEPDKQGGQAQVEHAGTRSYDIDSLEHEVPVIMARIGFTPNEGMQR